MMGKDLYNKLSKRDYSNSPKDKYAQELQTYWYNCAMNGRESDFYKLLETAEKEGKKLSLSDELVDEITFDNITLV